MAILLGLHTHLEDTSVKRPIILLATVLALVLAACGSDQTDTSPTPTSTPASTPTPEPTPEPTESEGAETPDATDDDGETGSSGELAAMLPDEVGGLERQPTPAGMDDMLMNMLEAQGLGGDGMDFAYAMWGQGELLVTAFQIPGMPEAQLGMLAQMMAGMGGQAGPSGEEVETEEVTIGGKEVLRITPEGQAAEGSVYVYQAGDAFFSVVAQDEALAEDLLSQLP